MTATLTMLIVPWALGYGALRAWWAHGHRPAFAPLGWDLLVATPWQPVVVCAVAIVVAVALRLAPGRWPSLAASVGVIVAILSSLPLLLLDAVGLLLPGLGLPLDPTATGSRLGYLTGAVLLAAVTRDQHRRRRGACVRCGRTGASRADVPAWARAGAYLAVAGCLIRLADQLVVGFAGVPPAEVAFDVGFLLAGVLLPLATTTGSAGSSHAGRCRLPAAACRAGWCSVRPASSASGSPCTSVWPWSSSSPTQRDGQPTARSRWRSTASRSRW